MSLISRIRTVKIKFIRKNFHRGSTTMSFSMFNIGGKIQVQYEVFRKKVSPELVWYNGKISELQMITDTSVRVTVRFEGSESFPECDESFITDNAGILSREGEEFPFRLQNLCADMESSQCNPLEGSGYLESNSMVQVMSKLSAMEKRLTALEKNSISQSMPPIYMIVCCLLNKSLKKFKNMKHKLTSTTDEVTAATWNVTQTCTYSDFKVFLAYLQTLTSGLEVSGNNEKTTASPHMMTLIPSFKQFCTLFSIADHHYEGLLSCQYSNRKGQLISFKSIGTILENKTNPSLPSILCLGGNAQEWCDSNYYFQKENSHTLSTGGYACDYEQLLTRQAHTSCKISLRDLTGSNLAVTWSIDGSSEICRPFQEGSHFIGNLVITIPYVVFSSARLATKIYKWMCPNRMVLNSTDSSSSSS